MGRLYSLRIIAFMIVSPILSVQFEPVTIGILSRHECQNGGNPY